MIYCLFYLECLIKHLNSVFEVKHIFSPLSPIILFYFLISFYSYCNCPFGCSLFPCHGFQAHLPSLPFSACHRQNENFWKRQMLFCHSPELNIQCTNVVFKVLPIPLHPYCSILSLLFFFRLPLFPSISNSHYYEKLHFPTSITIQYWEALSYFALTSSCETLLFLQVVVQMF